MSHKVLSLAIKPRAWIYHDGSYSFKEAEIVNPLLKDVRTRIAKVAISLSVTIKKLQHLLKMDRYLCGHFKFNGKPIFFSRSHNGENPTAPVHGGGIRILTEKEFIDDKFFIRRKNGNIEIIGVNSVEDANILISMWINQLSAGLAMGMTNKNLAIGISLSGAKGVITTVYAEKIGDKFYLKPLFKGDLYSEENKPAMAKICRTVARIYAEKNVVGVNIDKAAGDVNATQFVVEWMVEEHLKYLFFEKKYLETLVDERCLNQAQADVLQKQLQSLKEKEKANPDEFLVELPYLNMIIEFLGISGTHIPELGAYTGKLVKYGGTHLRQESTSLGGVIVTELYYASRNESLVGKTIAIQGCGSAGGGAMPKYLERGAKVVAINDSQVALSKPTGFTPDEAEYILKLKKEGRSLREILVAFPSSGIEILANRDALLYLDVDVLALAATEQQITKENADQIQAKLIIEIANDPVNSEAYESLYKKGIVVIPDSLASAGGVLGSFYEWLLNRRGLHEDEGMRDTFKKAFADALEELLKTRKEYEVDLRTAMDILVLGQRLKQIN